MRGVAVIASVLALAACKAGDSPALFEEAGSGDAVDSQSPPTPDPTPITAGLSQGPDGAAPIPCTGAAGVDTSQCTPPAPDCADDRFATGYGGGQCVSGSCRWSTVSADCAQYEGGRCYVPPGADGAAHTSFFIDGGVWLSLGPCAVPAPPAPAPTPEACAVDAGPDAAACTLPPSVCADDALSRELGLLIYYDSAECVAGQCVWQARYLQCPSGCRSGACAAAPLLGTLAQ